jgi:hypothetical protein
MPFIMSKSKVVLPQLSNEEVDKLYTYFTQFDKNYSKFKGSKREYIVYVIGIVQSKKKNKKMEGGAPKAKPAGKATAAASLSELPPKILYGIIEEVVTSLEKSMQRLIEIPVDEILNKIKQEKGYSELTFGERKSVDKELTERKKEETIRIAGPVGEDIALNFLKKHEKFKDVVRIPQPAEGIEPILDLKGMPKNRDDLPTLFEIKNKVHGSNDVGIQHTKIMAALYLMSNANTQYKKTLPIIVFIRGNPRSTTRREQADVGEVFDLVRILKKEKLGEEILSEAEKTEFQKLFNTTNAVDMAPGKNRDWINKTDDIITQLERKGYGSRVTDPTTGNVAFNFNISPESKLSTDNELEQIYSRMLKPATKKAVTKVTVPDVEETVSDVEETVPDVEETVPDVEKTKKKKKKKNRTKTDDIVPAVQEEKNSSKNETIFSKFYSMVSPVFKNFQKFYQNTEEKPTTGSGKKILCRFSSGLGAY